MVTPWKEKCGVAEYSRSLVESLRKLRTQVTIYQDKLYVVRLQSEQAMFSPTDLHGWTKRVRSFSRYTLFEWLRKTKANIAISRKNVVELYKAFSKLDVVNFQFEHGLFSPSDLLEWVTCFRRVNERTKLWITVHQVLENDSWIRFYDLVDGAIVHSKHFGAVLGEKTLVIPHGCPVYENVDKQEARRRLELGSGPFLATFGFMFPNKGWQFIIGSMPKIQQKYPNCTLLMLCSLWKDTGKTKPTAIAMKKFAKQIGANVRFFHDKWEIDEFMPMIQASDIFITSQEIVDRKIISGSSMMGISARRPTITNDCSIYNQIKPYSYVVPGGRPEKIAEAVINLLDDTELYNSHVEKALEAYGKFNWDTVSKQHLDLYSKDSVTAS